ncbi:MAG: endopeptidase La [Clostridia bacterium]|nr:endopeptidase La [Clostridia bacterium]
MAITREHIEKRTLPCIPMRGAVSFPNIPMNLEVGRSISKHAIDDAIANDSMIFLVCQRDATVDDPEMSDMYTVGTTAKIKQMMKADGGVYRVLVEPVERAVLEDIYKTKQGKMLLAEVMEKTVTFDDGGVVGEALVREINTAVKEFSKFIPKFSPDLRRVIESISDISMLCDFVAANMVAKIEDREELLSEFDPKRRANLLIFTLEKEKNVLSEEAKIHDEVRERMDKNQRDYYLREQMKVIREELGENDAFDDEDMADYAEKIEKSAFSDEIKEKLTKELKKLAKTPYGSAEGAVIRNYLDTCLEIPIGKFTKDRIDVDAARKILDDDHDGLDDVKERIIEFLAAQKLNPEHKNQIICLVGPPGTGKTSVASSIARAMNRKFIRMSLGGVRDEADIRGHRKTYIGSMPGRIITALVNAKTQNPLILMDEIDKLTSDAHGDPASALLEVLDGEQNKAFRDHFIEFPVDISNCMFITTANTLDTVPAPLIDRMEIIEMKIYTRSEKFSIARNHLIKKQAKRHGLDGRTFKISDDALYTLIDEYTHEAGVRQLERVIAKCCRRAAKQIVCGEKKTVKVTKDNITVYAGEERMHKDKILDRDEIGTVCGMAYTELGGEVMLVEALALSGNGKTELTGSLGEVMKESAQAAISYIRSCAEKLGIDPDFYKTKDIHVHFPEGAVPKDGPSAGVTIATAIASELSGIPVRRDVAMTGEINLRGRVMAIGGLREKTMAAYLAGVKTILIPEENRADMYQIMPVVKENVEIICISSVAEAIDIAFCTKPEASEKKDRADEISEYIQAPDIVQRQTRVDAKHAAV